MENSVRKASSDTSTNRSEESDTKKDKNIKTPGQSAKSSRRKSISRSGKKSSALLPSARKVSKTKNLNNILKKIPVNKMADNNSSTKTFANFTTSRKTNSTGPVKSQSLNKTTKANISKSEDAPVAAKVNTNRLHAENSQALSNKNPKSGPPKKSIPEASLSLKKVVPSNTLAAKRAATLNRLSRPKATASSKVFESTNISNNSKRIPSASSASSKRSTSTSSLAGSSKENNLAEKKMLSTRDNISTRNSSLAAKKVASSTNAARTANRRDVFFNNPSTSTRSSAAASNPSTRSRSAPNTLATKKMACKLIDYRESSSSKSSSTSRNASIARNLAPSSGLTNRKTASTNSIAGKVPTESKFPNNKRAATSLAKDGSLGKKTTVLKNANPESFKKPLQAEGLDKARGEPSKTHPVSKVKKTSVVLEKVPIKSSGSKERRTSLRLSGTDKKSLSVSFNKESLSSSLGHNTTLFKSPTRPIMTMKSNFLPPLDTQSSMMPNVDVPVLSTMEEINCIKKSVEAEKDIGKDNKEADDKRIRVMLENNEEISNKNMSIFSKRQRPGKKSNLDGSILNLSKIGEEDDALEGLRNNSLGASGELAKCLQENEQLNEEVNKLKSQNKNLTVESKKLIHIETLKQTNLQQKINAIENENVQLNKQNEHLKDIISRFSPQILENLKEFEFGQLMNLEDTSSVQSSSLVIDEGKEEFIKDVISDIVDSAVKSSSQFKISSEIDNLERTVEDILLDIVQNISENCETRENDLPKDGSFSTATFVENKLTTIKSSKLENRATSKRKCSFENRASHMAKKKKLEREELVSDDSHNWTQDVHDLVCNIENVDDKLKDDSYIDVTKKCIGEVFVDIMNKIDVYDTEVMTKPFSVDEILMDIVDTITLGETCNNTSNNQNECGTPVKMLKRDIGQTFLKIMNKMDEKHSEIKNESFSMDEILLDIVDTITDGKDPKRTLKRKLVDDENECDSRTKKPKIDLQIPVPWE